MRFSKSLTYFAATIILFAGQLVDANEWDEATHAIKRLAPNEFHTLPSHIRKQLTTKGCTIPQYLGNTAPHNVIKGEFEKPGQKDWAVLCSRNYSSSILIFWGGQVSCPSEILSSPDRSWLQNTGEGIGYSRVIATVDLKFIFKHIVPNEESSPAPITHQGINQSFVGKGSTVQYCVQGKWIELPGAD